MAKADESRPVRRDALANRERLLVTAEEYYDRWGIDAPMHGIAAAANVGVGTLYRNFATHRDLIGALFDRIVERLDEVAAECVASPTAWDAITTYVSRSVELMVRHPATQAIMRRHAEYEPGAPQGDRWAPLMAHTLKQAKADGTIRGDVTATDMAMIPFALSNLHNFPENQRMTIAARQITLMLDGLRAHPHPSTPLPEAALSIAELRSATIGRDT